MTYATHHQPDGTYRIHVTGPGYRYTRLAVYPTRTDALLALALEQWLAYSLPSPAAVGHSLDTHA